MMMLSTESPPLPPPPPPPPPQHPSSSSSLSLSSSLSKNRRRTPKTKVVLELPQEFRSIDENNNKYRFAGPFLLGFSIALILILVPSLAGLYWVCKDVPYQVGTVSKTRMEHNPTTSLQLSEWKPSSSSPPKRGGGLLRNILGIGNNKLQSTKHSSQTTNPTINNDNEPSLSQQQQQQQQHQTVSIDYSNSTTTTTTTNTNNGAVPSECFCLYLWQSLEKIFGRRLLRLIFSSRLDNSNSTSSSFSCPYTISNSSSKSLRNKKSSNNKDKNANDNAAAENILKYKKEYSKAFTPEYIQLSDTQKMLITKLMKQVQDSIPNFISRANAVKWGKLSSSSSSTTTAGATNNNNNNNKQYNNNNNKNYKKNTIYNNDGQSWFDPTLSSSTKSSDITTTDLETLTGGQLFYSYLRVMEWPKSLRRTKFPNKLCKTSNGCNAEFAIAHTLEWREKYRPWQISELEIKENQNGCVYVRGFSPPLLQDNNDNIATLHDKKQQQQQQQYNRDSFATKSLSLSQHHHGNAQHAIVWVRPGLRTVVDDISYTRVFMNTLDRAVAVSLERSNGRVGKFNIILDGTGLTFQTCPTIKGLRMFVTMLQDHFPNKLGSIVLVNLGRAGEFIVNVIKPLLSKEVRDKLKILPTRDVIKRQQILQAIVGEKDLSNIPTWLGGTDTFEFNVNDYYATTQVVDSKVTREYLQTMPYHA